MDGNIVPINVIFFSFTVSRKLILHNIVTNQLLDY